MSSITHSKVSGKPAGTDPTRVYGTDWDAEHVVTGLVTTDGTESISGAKTFANNGGLRVAGSGAGVLFFNNLNSSSNDYTASFQAATGTVPLLESTQTWTGANTFPNNGGARIGGSSTGVTFFASANSSASNYTATIPAATDTFAMLGLNQAWTGANTFANNGGARISGSSTGVTLLNSANSSATNYTITFPAATDTLAMLGQTQTWTGANTFPNNGGVRILGSSTGSNFLASANSGASNFTTTIPALTDTLVTKTSTDVLTNKTYDTAGTGNSLSIAGVAVTANNGTGAVVRTTSPALVTPALGTPASGTLTSCTGLPIASGVSGLATGVATFLATPSSANLRAALTDEVGTGAAYFVGGALGTPASATLTNATGLPLAGLATQAAYTIVGNFTGSAAVPTATALSGLTQKASPAATDLVLLQDQAASGQLKYATVSSVASAGSVASLGGQTGTLTFDGGSMSSTVMKVVRYDAAQSLASADKVLAQANIGVAEVLTSSRTYYVRTDGSNANTGLANTAGGAKLTIQAAVDAATAVNANGSAVTIQVADGTYTGGVTVSQFPINAASFTINGNLVTPSNCIISTTNADCILVDGVPRPIFIGGFKFQTTTSGNGLHPRNGSNIYQNGAVNYGACADSHNYVDGSVLVHAAAYTVSGGAGNHHHHLINWGIIGADGIAVTITGSPTITSYWAGLASGFASYSGATFSGAVTTEQYYVHLGGVLKLAGATLPGIAGENPGGGNVDNVLGNVVSPLVTVNSVAGTPFVKFQRASVEKASMFADSTAINVASNSALSNGVYMTYSTNGWNNFSDAAGKYEIEDLDVLSIFDRFPDTRYAKRYKEKSTGSAMIGPVAQEQVGPFWELVDVGGDHDEQSDISFDDPDKWGVKYAHYGPVALQAARQLYDLVVKQGDEIRALREKAATA